ncbi:MAG: NRDE family protein, partial [Thermoguttaceae bacterium]
TMAILYRAVRSVPILVAYNREERFDRPTQYPKIQPGSPRVVCGIDRKAGGTWFGVNQNCLFCAVLNRPKHNQSLELRSRGLLCRELLEMRNAREASEYAAEELATDMYAGANFVCADPRFAAVVYGGNKVEVMEIPPGLHIITNGDMDDFRDERHQLLRRMLTLHMLDSAVTFLAVASRTFSRRPDSSGRRGVVVLGKEYGTVSSTLLALSRKIPHSILQYSPGPPCDHSYDDLSALLRQVLSANRSRKNRAVVEKAKAAKKSSRRQATTTKAKIKKK